MIEIKLNTTPYEHLRSTFSETEELLYYVDEDSDDVGIDGRTYEERLLSVSKFDDLHNDFKITENGAYDHDDPFEVWANDDEYQASRDNFLSELLTHLLIYSIHELLDNDEILKDASKNCSLIKVHEEDFIRVVDTSCIDPSNKEQWDNCNVEDVTIAQFVIPKELKMFKAWFFDQIHHGEEFTFEYLFDRYIEFEESVDKSIKLTKKIEEETQEHAQLAIK